jgi:thiol-disulfide isomerase/thioredoxin
MRGKSALFAAALAAALAAAPLARALDFKPYARGSFAELKKAHAGRPFIAHYWSVTCAPCLAELGEWAKIVARKPGFDVVFVNTDGPGDRARAVLRLDKAGLASGAHYAFDDDFAEKLFYEADPTWRGELPFTALVDGAGGVVTVVGAVDDPLIVDWLAKSAR